MTLDLSKLYQYLVDGVNAVLQFLFDNISAFFQKAAVMVIDALAALVSGLPAPDFMNQLPQAGESLSSAIGANAGLGWFLGMVNFQAGVTTVLGALLFRFILRRIPGIG